LTVRPRKQELKKPLFRILIHLIQIRIHHFGLNTDPDNKTAEKKIFGSKTTIYLSLGLHKGFPSYRRSLQPSKENIQHFKT
jgi:hypothetical protein